MRVKYNSFASCLLRLLLTSLGPAAGQQLRRRRRKCPRPRAPGKGSRGSGPALPGPVESCPHSPGPPTYSSPGALTCGKCTGSLGHERQDARTFADWGFDYLKYDWCYYRNFKKPESLSVAMKPYQVMGKALKEQNRDIVFSLCQYGWLNVETWGRKAYGQLCPTPS